MRFNLVYVILSCSQVFVIGWGLYALTVNQNLIQIWLSNLYNETLVFDDNNVLIPCIE